MGFVNSSYEEGIVKISLNRTDVLNAINSVVLKELKEILETYSKNEDVKALLLYGEGGCFASGADIKELASFDEKGMRDFHRLREDTFALLEYFPSPTLAMIEGYALGTGLELALCCDLRIASEETKLGVPSARLGIVESYEYIARLIRTVGVSMTKELIFTARRIDAKRAYEIGLINEITKKEELLPKTEKILKDIAKNSIYSMRNSKIIIRECEKDINFRFVIDRASPMVESLKGKDFKEGVSAFLEKREAKFK